MYQDNSIFIFNEYLTLIYRLLRVRPHNSFFSETDFITGIDGYDTA